MLKTAINYTIGWQEFEELDRETVAMIVSRDDLRLRNEIEVLMALLRWSVFECHRRQLDTTLENQRIVLDDLIWQVRYLTMSVEDLWKVPIVSHWGPAGGRLHAGGEGNDRGGGHCCATN